MVVQKAVMVRRAVIVEKAVMVEWAVLVTGSDGVGCADWVIPSTHPELPFAGGD